jgi:hypothetical protein
MEKGKYLETWVEKKLDLKIDMDLRYLIKYIIFQRLTAFTAYDFC